MAASLERPHQGLEDFAAFFEVFELVVGGARGREQDRISTESGRTSLPNGLLQIHARINCEAIPERGFDWGCVLANREDSLHLAFAGIHHGSIRRPFAPSSRDQPDWSGQCSQ